MEATLQMTDLAMLVGRAKRGDLAAFEQILVRHQRMVLATSLRLLGRLEDAQDAAQEVFLKLHRNLHQFNEERDFTPWLYRVTVNVCRDHQRARQRRWSPLDDEPEQTAKGPTPEASLLVGEHARVVAEGLKTLPEKERAALVLREIEGLSTREVAAVLGSSEETVRSQVSTARVKLRKFADKALGRRS